MKLFGMGFVARGVLLLGTLSFLGCSASHLGQIGDACDSAANCVGGLVCSEQVCLEADADGSDWPTPCDTDNGCGELSCICGICTQACEDPLSCREPYGEGAECIPLVGVEGAVCTSGGKLRKVCRPACGGADCEGEPAGSKPKGENGICEADESPTDAPLDCQVVGDDLCTGDETADDEPEACQTEGDGLCTGDETPTDAPEDCREGGDGLCTGTETIETNPHDCTVRGDGLCTSDETPMTAPEDCSDLGDGLCTGDETAEDEPDACQVAGDGLCTGTEFPGNPSDDCGEPGDDICSPLETARDEPGVCPRLFAVNAHTDNTWRVRGISADGRWLGVLQTDWSRITQSEYELATRWDIASGTVETVSRKTNGDIIGLLGEDGVRSAAMSSDGNTLCFGARTSSVAPPDANGFADIFCHDLTTGVVERVNLSDADEEAVGGDSHSVRVSPTARFVVFESEATNLVADAPAGRRTYVRDRQLGATHLLGTHVVISHDDGTFYYDGPGDTRVSFKPATGELETVSDVVEHFGYTDDAGRLRVFITDQALLADDSNDLADLYLEEVATGELRRLNLRPDGSEATTGGVQSARITPDGRFVAFNTSGNLLTGTHEDPTLYMVYVGDLFD